MEDLNMLALLIIPFLALAVSWAVETLRLMRLEAKREREAREDDSNEYWGD